MNITIANGTNSIKLLVSGLALAADSNGNFSATEVGRKLQDRDCEPAMRKAFESCPQDPICINNIDSFLVCMEEPETEMCENQFMTVFHDCEDYDTLESTFRDGVTHNGTDCINENCAKAATKLLLCGLVGNNTEIEAADAEIDALVEQECDELRPSANPSQAPSASDGLTELPTVPIVDSHAPSLRPSSANGSNTDGPTSVPTPLPTSVSSAATISGASKAATVFFMGLAVQSALTQAFLT
jgi:hypothetical protein